MSWSQVKNCDFVLTYGTPLDYKTFGLVPHEELRFVLTYGEPLGLVDGVVAELGRPRLVVIVRFVLLTYVYLQTSTMSDNTR